MPTPPRSDDTEADEERRRRVLVLLAVVFLLVLFGGVGAVVTDEVFAPSDPLGGKGELTVELEDQNGEAVSGKEVQIVDPDTGEVVATGTTGENGAVAFTLDQGEYEVVAGERSEDVSLDEDSETIGLDVTVAPPEPNGSLGAGGGI